MRVAFVVLLLAAGTAAAQPVAVDSSTQQARARHRHGPEGPAAFGGGGAFGWGGQVGGKSGWSVRLEGEQFPLYDGGDSGVMLGMLHGFEAWRSGEDNWGVSFPVAFVFGARVSPMRAMIGFGLDAILIDQVDDDTGVGFYAPFALAKLGTDVDGFQFGVDARLGYRWQIDAPDHARWQLGLYVAKTVDMRAARRKKAAVAIARGTVMWNRR